MLNAGKTQYDTKPWIAKACKNWILEAICPECSTIIRHSKTTNYDLIRSLHGLDLGNWLAIMQIGNETR